MNQFLLTFSDIGVMIKRNLLRYRRIPQLIVFSSVQPVMFLLLFNYVFGGAIKIPGISYISYLLPGILVQTVLFGSMQTGIGLAEDMSKGIIDRFRSLPMARSAVLAGRTITESIRNLFVMCILIGFGILMGFRIENGIGNFILAVALASSLGFAFSWISATIGLAVKNIETVQVAGFIWIFPLVFASSIFVPVETMSNGIRFFAERNPISYVVNSVRALSLGQPIGDNLFYSILWIIGILLVFIPLSVSLYKRNS